ncbi:hypothetical protein [Candidatus Oleimmundimicrobium sp.]|uniref:hypothetical protein n=1 Tax=Candidatus Oleimmundimicrobium sp. TaxID=3060597 RepID=UPI00271BC6AC|nr:hypothetical protein [Candidatus Oleimmundimicrobium sp.]MDO8885728.1 hypothetical protein [Candidatus Oleimmundimicrobium sp.]
MADPRLEAIGLTDEKLKNMIYTISLPQNVNKLQAAALRAGYTLYPTKLSDGNYFIGVGATYKTATKIYNEAQKIGLTLYGSILGGTIDAPPLAEAIEDDPYMRLIEYEKELGWEKWVTENEQDVSEMFKRWTGKQISHDELMQMAKGAHKELIQEYQRLAEYEQWRPEFHKYFGREPAVKDIEDVKGRFATPGEYGLYLGAGEQAEKYTPEISELWRTEYGKIAPGREQLTKYLMGGEGSGDFQRKYEEAKVRKEYRWKSQQATPRFQMTKAGITTPSLAKWQEW